MARGKTSDEEVSAKEAAKRLGMTEAALGQWGSRPGAPGRLDKGRRFYLWPDFPIWYRNELKRIREKPADFEAARSRKMAAEAEIAEYELAQLRGSLVPEETLDKVYGERLDRLRARLQTLPGQGASRTVGLKTLTQSQEVWEAVVRDLMTDLAHGHSGR